MANSDLTVKQAITIIDDSGQYGHWLGFFTFTGADGLGYTFTRESLLAEAQRIQQETQS